MKIVFTWIQWCWKWTQARILVEKHGFKLVEMWAEFRRVVNSWTELWNKIKEIIDSWAQVNAELWKEVMKEAILNNIDNPKIIFDGFIRNEWNVEVFNELVSDYIIVHFDLSIEKARERLLWRMFDPETWETFPSSIKINPKNGNILVKRDDDKDEKAILKRISEYEEKTIPVIEKAKETLKVIVVNADQKIEDVSLELEKKLFEK